MTAAREARCFYIKLKSGGYRLMADWTCDTDIKGYDIEIPGYVKLTRFGLLTVYAGYQWDGASGPVIDRKANMHAGLAHDALYQLMREGLLPQSIRPLADKLYRELYIENNGFSFIGWLDYAGLRLFAGSSAKPQPEVESKKHSV